MSENSKKTIKEIKDAIVLSTFINKTITLKKNGNVFLGRCPFHEEKTASFVVSDTKRYYRCFGCGAVGDIFDFIRRTKQTTFFQAIQIAAKYANLQPELGAFYNKEATRYTLSEHNYASFLRNILRQHPYFFDDPRGGEFLPSCCQETEPPTNSNSIMLQLYKVMTWLNKNNWELCKQNATAYLQATIALQKSTQLLNAMREQPNTCNEILFEFFRQFHENKKFLHAINKESLKYY